VSDTGRREDAFRVLEIFRRATGEKARMWGPAIVGFGHHVMKYESGREFDWMRVAFSPRKNDLTLYVFNDSPRQNELLAKLGKIKTSKACLYIKRLSDVDEKVLEELVRDSIEHSKN
jgi:hypothetical protein